MFLALESDLGSLELNKFLKNEMAMLCRLSIALKA
jgi:hypothetical protein